MKVWLPTVRAGTGADVFSERLLDALGRRGIPGSISWFGAHCEFWPQLARCNPPAGTTVIHANAMSAFAFAGLGYPVVATDHGTFCNPRFIASKPFVQRLYQRLVVDRYIRKSFDACIATTAVSAHLADAIRQQEGIDVRTIPNWIDTTRFTPAPRPRGGGFRLLYAGSSSFRKGFDVVRDLAARLGDGVTLYCQRSLAARLGPHARVRIECFDKLPADAMPALYATVDAVLMPSRYEGFGYVALEAMACARPVIGFTTLAEVCGPDAAALVSVGDAEAMSAAVARLAADPALCARMGNAGRQRAVDHYTESKAIDAYASLYEEVASAAASVQ